MAPLIFLTSTSKLELKVKIVDSFTARYIRPRDSTPSIVGSIRKTGYDRESSPNETFPQSDMTNQTQTYLKIWLQQAITAIKPIFYKAGFEVPDRHATAVFACSVSRSVHIGQCWSH